MSIETALTSLLGIRHPVLLAPMDVIAGARLTAAVSGAGGFGILGGGYGERVWLEQETEKLKQQAAPFGVGERQLRPRMRRPSAEIVAHPC